MDDFSELHAALGIPMVRAAVLGAIRCLRTTPEEDAAFQAELHERQAAPGSPEERAVVAKHMQAFNEMRARLLAAAELKLELADLRVPDDETGRARYAAYDAVVGRERFQVSLVDCGPHYDFDAQRAKIAHLAPAAQDKILGLAGGLVSLGRQMIETWLAGHAELVAECEQRTPEKIRPTMWQTKHVRRQAAAASEARDTMVFFHRDIRQCVSVRIDRADLAELDRELAGVRRLDATEIADAGRMLAAETGSELAAEFVDEDAGDAPRKD